MNEQECRGGNPRHPQRPLQGQVSRWVTLVCQFSLPLHKLSQPLDVRSWGLSLASTPGTGKRTRFLSARDRERNRLEECTRMDPAQSCLCLPLPAVRRGRHPTATTDATAPSPGAPLAPAVLLPAPVPACSSHTPGSEPLQKVPNGSDSQRYPFSQGKAPSQPRSGCRAGSFSAAFSFPATAGTWRCWCR